LSWQVVEIKPSNINKSGGGAVEAAVTNSAIKNMQEQLKAAEEKLQSALREKEELKRQLQQSTARATDLRTSLTASKKREQLLNTQVRQLTVFSDLTQAKLAQSRADTEKLSAMLAQGQGLDLRQLQSSLPEGDELERELRAQGLGMDTPGGLTPTQQAMRTAQLAASLVDPSGGKLLQQWAISGDGAAAKLAKIQQRADQVTGVNSIGNGNKNNSFYNGDGRNGLGNSTNSLGAFLQRSQSSQGPNGFNGPPSPGSPSNLSASGGTASQSASPATLSRFQAAGKKSAKGYMNSTASSSFRIANRSTRNANSSGDEGPQ
jgi:regulator of replication initiation timing